MLELWLIVLCLTNSKVWYNKLLALEEVFKVENCGKVWIIKNNNNESESGDLKKIKF